ncbi:sensor histidine kinase [Leucobacter albus]|uniref:Sensor-like histidine kinase SenX3 n=1 Tax=Leucobacter albus TaxID=272210 RepID=A0ABW3TLG3_9MICO
MLQLAELPQLHGLPETAPAILDGLDVFAVILDRDLRAVYANEVARKSENPTELGLLRTIEFRKRAEGVLATGTPSHRDPKPDDPGAPVRTHVIRIEGDFLAVIAEDLAEEQRLTAMRRDFIANVSHELKTPIAAVGLLAEAVKEAADDPELVREFAASLVKESKRLADLSRDIIQLSEAQSTLRPEQLEHVDLRAVVEDEIDAHESFAERRGVDLVFIDSSTPKRTSAMQGRQSAIASAVANILSNAIRHSPAGASVRVRIAHKKRHFTVTITDAGPGIAPEHLERIFERFYRVDGARSRDDGGTGLGLSIARHSLRAHGGDVTVRSTPGEGSRFTLSFPLSDIPKKKRAKRVKRTRKALQQLTDTKGRA